MGARGIQRPRFYFGDVVNADIHEVSTFVLNSLSRSMLLFSRPLVRRFLPSFTKPLPNMDRKIIGLTLRPNWSHF